MLSTDTSEELRGTVTSQWRNGLVGATVHGKAHWRTKVSYYRAVAEVLGRTTGGAPSWREVVARVLPHGSRTTFYDVAGPHAKYPLLSALAGSEDPEVMQVALCYRRDDAIEYLIDEAKVWSFWPYRESILDHPWSVADPDAELTRAVTDWARDHPALARALDFAPPACAVEDLVRLRVGTLAGLRAYRSMSATIDAVLAGASAR